MNQKILFMVQVPPPVHGASLRNLSLFESRVLNTAFEIKLLPLSFVTHVNEIGKISLGKLWKSLIYAVTLTWIIISFRPAVSYFTITPAGGAFYRDCLFVLILKVFRVRIIYHLRGIGIQNAMSRNSINRFLYRRVFNNTFVVCLSPTHLQDIQGLRIRGSFVVPNGIKVEYEGGQATPRTDKCQFLFLSNLVRSKGVYEFLHALKALHAKRSDFEALLVGAAVDTTVEEIADFIRKEGLESCVKVSGPLYKADKFKAIGACDVFVFPTYYPFELFPGVILEAMQCEKPVISTDHGVIRDIIDEGVTGFLVPVRNVEALTERMDYLLQHRERIAEMGAAGKTKFFNEFTLEKFENAMKEVFSNVIRQEAGL